MIQHSTQGAVNVVSFTGALTTEEAEELRDAVTPRSGAGRPQVVLDLAETSLIDSAGCEALLGARDAVTGVGGAIHLCGLNPLCHDVLLATGVSRYFQIFESAPQAVAQFSK